MEVIDELAKCLPEKHVVDLENAELFILVEIFKVCQKIFCCCQITHYFRRAYVVSA